jgi:hypothetical protein
MAVQRNLETMFVRIRFFRFTSRYGKCSGGFQIFLRSIGQIFRGYYTVSQEKSRNKIKILNDQDGTLATGTAERGSPSSVFSLKAKPFL